MQSEYYSCYCVIYVSSVKIGIEDLETEENYLYTFIPAMASSLENLETQLEMFIENVRQIRIIVGDFQPQGQSVLNQKMLVNSLPLVY